MAEDNEPPDSKLTRTKEKWAREGRFLTGKITRPEDQRLPPGQHLTKDWPVLDLGVVPPISREHWRLDVYGAIENPVFWTFAEFAAQKQAQFISDIHCVTTWSRYDNEWEGLATRELLAACQPRPDARFVVLHSHDGSSRWTTLPPRTHCSPIAGPVSHCRPNMAARYGWSCRICISGRAPNGFSRSNS